jgi:hypothetical protein
MYAQFLAPFLGLGLQCSVAVLMLLPYILVNHEECFECSQKFIHTLILRNVHQVNCEEWSNFKVFTRACLHSSFEERAPSVTMNHGGGFRVFVLHAKLAKW